MGRVFANGPGALCSVPGRVIPNIFKIVLDTSLLNTQDYKARIKGKAEQSRESSSYWKGSLLVALDNGRQQLYSFFVLILVEF